MQVRKGVKRILAIVMMCVFCAPYLTVTASEMASSSTTKFTQADMLTDRVLRILEIQPGNNFKLDKQDIANAFGIVPEKVELTQMAVTLFNADRKPLNGLYDIIYIGDGIGKEVTYYNKTYIERYCTEILPPETNVPRYPYMSSGYGSDNSRSPEDYTGIDLTYLKAGEIQQFIDEGQLVVMEEDLFAASKVIDLSTLTGKKVEGVIATNQATNSAAIQLKADGSVKRYDTGIGMEPPEKRNGVASATYALNGQYDTFTAKIGINQQGGTSNSLVDFEVYVDGSRVKTESDVKYNANQREITVPVTGANTLKLVVKNRVSWFTLSRDNYAVWADAKLTKGVPVDTATVLYNSFEAGVADGDVCLVPVGNTVGASALSTIEEAYQDVQSKRPYLNVIRDDRNEQSKYDLAFKVTAHDYTDATGNMTAKVYLDANGDGLYQDNECVESITQGGITNKHANSSFAMHVAVPQNYTGYLSWKIEVEDVGTGVKNYVTGSVEYEVPEVVTINVLNIVPDSGETFRLEHLQYMFDELEEKFKYNIELTTKTVSAFQNQYRGSNKSHLNGVYDMVVLGFADPYKGLTSNDAINDLKQFIASKQSVMFNHDSLYFPFSNSNENRIMTIAFREILGQGTYDASATQNKYGYTNYVLGNVLGGMYPSEDTASYVKKISDGQLTTYPYILENMPVQRTHNQYYRLDLEDEAIQVWYTYMPTPGTSSSTAYAGHKYNWYDPANSYYTYSRDNITYCGSGHSNPSWGQLNIHGQEAKLFINTIIRAAKTANHAPEVSIVDLKADQMIDYTNDLVFNIQANDEDLFDTTVDYKIYATGTKKKDELIATLNEEKMGEPIQITLEKAMLHTITDQDNTLELRVQATDPQGAIGDAAVKVNCIEPHVKITQVFDKSGYLVGDTAKVKVSVEADTTVVNEADIQNVTIVTRVYDSTTSQEVLNKTQLGGYDTQPFVFTQTADNKVETKVSYEIDGVAYSTSRIDIIDVKQGKLQILVEDELNTPLSGVEVVVKYGTQEDVYTTGIAGSITLDNQPSGTYTIAFKQPNSYLAANGQLQIQTATLQYDTTDVKAYQKQVKLGIVIDNELPNIMHDYRSKKLTNEDIEILAKLDGTGSNIVEAKWYKGEVTSVSEATAIESAGVADTYGIITTAGIPPASETSKEAWESKILTVSPSETESDGTHFIQWGRFDIKENGTYTIYAEDQGGNFTFYTLYINNKHQGELPDIT